MRVGTAHAGAATHPCGGPSLRRRRRRPVQLRGRGQARRERARHLERAYLRRHRALRAGRADENQAQHRGARPSSSRSSSGLPASILPARPVQGPPIRLPAARVPPARRRRRRDDGASPAVAVAVEPRVSTAAVGAAAPPYRRADAAARRDERRRPPGRGCSPSQPRCSGSSRLLLARLSACGRVRSGPGRARSSSRGRSASSASRPAARSGPQACGRSRLARGRRGGSAVARRRCHPLRLVRDLSPTASDAVAARRARRGRALDERTERDPARRLRSRSERGAGGPGACALLALGGGASSRPRSRSSSRSAHDPARPRSLPQGTNGVVVLDVSASISKETYARIAATLERLARSRGRYGLVLFSDTAYQALPPGTPARSSGAFERFFRVPQATTPGGTPHPPRNPWSDHVQRRHADLDGSLGLRSTSSGPGTSAAPLVILVSDLDDDAGDIERLTSVALAYRKLGIPIRVVGLNPSPEDDALVERLLEHPGDLGPRPFPASAAPASRRRLPALLVVLALAARGRARASARRHGATPVGDGMTQAPLARRSPQLARCLRAAIAHDARAWRDVASGATVYVHAPRPGALGRGDVAPRRPGRSAAARIATTSSCAAPSSRSSSQCTPGVASTTACSRAPRRSVAEVALADVAAHAPPRAASQAKTCSACSSAGRAASPADRRRPRIAAFEAAMRRSPERRTPSTTSSSLLRRSARRRVRQGRAAAPGPRGSGQRGAGVWNAGAGVLTWPACSLFLSPRGGFPLLVALAPLAARLLDSPRSSASARALGPPRPHAAAASSPRLLCSSRSACSSGSPQRSPSVRTTGTEPVRTESQVLLRRRRVPLDARGRRAGRTARLERAGPRRPAPRRPCPTCRRARRSHRPGPAVRLPDTRREDVRGRRSRSVLIESPPPQQVGTDATSFDALASVRRRRLLQALRARRTASSSPTARPRRTRAADVGACARRKRAAAGYWSSQSGARRAGLRRRRVARERIPARRGRAADRTALAQVDARRSPSTRTTAGPPPRSGVPPTSVPSDGRAVERQTPARAVLAAVALAARSRGSQQRHCYRLAREARGAYHPGSMEAQASNHVRRARACGSPSPRCSAALRSCPSPAAHRAASPRRTATGMLRPDARQQPPFAADRDHPRERRRSSSGPTPSTSSSSIPTCAVASSRIRSRSTAAFRDDERRQRLRARRRDRQGASGSTSRRTARIFKNFGIVANRGLAYCDGRLFIAQLDMKLVALRPSDGKVLGSSRSARMSGTRPRTTATRRRARRSARTTASSSARQGRSTASAAS